MINHDKPLDFEVPRYPVLTDKAHLGSRCGPPAPFLLDRWDGPCKRYSSVIRRSMHINGCFRHACSITSLIDYLCMICFCIEYIVFTCVHKVILLYNYLQLFTYIQWYTCMYKNCIYIYRYSIYECIINT